MSVAKAYARALYESAQEARASSEEMDRIETQLDYFIKIVDEDKGAKNALYGPVATGKEKSAIVEALADKGQFSGTLKNFLSLVAAKGRLPIIHEVRDAFSFVRLTSEGGVQGKLEAADNVNNEDVQGLAQAFSRKLGKKVAFRVSTDPSLLAGMKVTVNGVTYDGTLRSQLERLRDRFVSGFSGK